MLSVKCQGLVVSRILQGLLVWMLLVSTKPPSREREGRLAQLVRAPALQAREPLPDTPFIVRCFQPFQQFGESASRSKLTRMTRIGCVLAQFCYSPTLPLGRLFGNPTLPFAGLLTAPFQRTHTTLQQPALSARSC
jgi:hypothetical protein